MEAYYHLLEIPQSEHPQEVHPGWHAVDLHNLQNWEDPVDQHSSGDLVAVALPCQVDLAAAPCLDVDAEEAADQQTCPFRHFGALAGQEAFLVADQDVVAAACPFASVVAALRAGMVLHAVVLVLP